MIAQLIHIGACRHQYSRTCFLLLSTVRSFIVSPYTYTQIYVLHINAFYKCIMFLAYHKYNKNVPEYVEHFGALSNLEQWRWLRGWYRTWPSYICVCNIFPCLCYIYTIHIHIGGIGTWPSYICVCNIFPCVYYIYTIHIYTLVVSARGPVTVSR